MNQNFTNTEQSTASEIGEVSNFSFSTNRSKDWGNLLTHHKNGEKVCVFNTEDKTIIKQKICNYN